MLSSIYSTRLGLKPGDLVAMLDGYTAYLDVSRGAEPVYVLGGY